MNIVVSLPNVRTHVGSLELRDDQGQVLAGPFPALGKADNDEAKRRNNEHRIPTLPYGDTPTGSYSVEGYKATGTGSHPSFNYGPNGAIALLPTGGEALEAKNNGRTGILIHGGRLAFSGALRPTNGCLRLSDADMASLMASISGHEAEVGRCEVVTVSISEQDLIAAPSNPADIINDGDPPPSFLDDLLKHTPQAAPLPHQLHPPELFPIDNGHQDAQPGPPTNQPAPNPAAHPPGAPPVENQNPNNNLDPAAPHGAHGEVGPPEPHEPPAKPEPPPKPEKPEPPPKPEKPEKPEPIGGGVLGKEKNNTFVFRR